MILFRQHKFYLGVLGMSEYEYYTNSPYVNFCKAEGYKDRYDHEIQPFRALAAITHGSMVGKDATPIAKLWPMWYDGKTDKIEVDDEMMDRILKTHGLNKIK